MASISTAWKGTPFGNPLDMNRQHGSCGDYDDLCLHRQNLNFILLLNFNKKRFVSMERVQVPCMLG